MQKILETEASPGIENADTDQKNKPSTGQTIVLGAQARREESGCPC